MVEARCRALMAAARWNGHAAQATTGRARTAATQPQFGNWKAGIIEIAKHRDGEHGRHDEPRAERGCGCGRHRCWPATVPAGVCGLHRRARVPGGPDRGLVARGRDRGGDLVVGDVRRDGDAGGLKGQVDGGLDAVELSELAFDPVDAGGAGHALDIEVNDAASGLVQQLLVAHGALLFSVDSLSAVPLSGVPASAAPLPTRRGSLRLRWRPPGSRLRRLPRRFRRTTVLRWR